MHLVFFSFVFFVLSSFLHCFPLSPSYSLSQLPHCSSGLTASQQHAHLTHTPSAAFLLFGRRRTLSCRSPFHIAFLLLSGDTELNPGPSSFTVCTLNIRSILHPLHSAALSDLIDTHNPDLFCLTETWIRHTTTPAELLNCTPPNYTFLSCPRNGSSSISSSGGGTGFLIRQLRGE